MIIACATTTQLPSETANSIQAVMACEGLRRCGAEIGLFVPGSGSISFEEVRDHYGMYCEPFPVAYLHSDPHLHRMDFTLSALSRANKMHAQVCYTWTIQLAAAAALRGMETAYEIHDLPTGGGIHWFDLYTREKAAKKIICITKALQNRLLAHFPHLKEEDCLIMPNGYSPEDYETLPELEAAKQQMGFSLDRPVVSCSGHLYNGRGSELFLHLASRFPKADFHWFGGTAEAVDRCREEALRNGLSNVTFHGFVPRDRLPLAQAACDILLMPYDRHIAGSGGGNSAEICSPMKMFEYMAEGRCIISSDLPVIHEVLDENCAVFCEPEDADSWTAGLSSVLNDTVLRKRLAEAAKACSVQYTWQKRAEKYLNGRKHA
jgi:glycosyltransferase involved in cell wall biosynthesis